MLTFIVEFVIYETPSLYVRILIFDPRFAYLYNDYLGFDPELLLVSILNV